MILEIGSLVLDGADVDGMTILLQHADVVVEVICKPGTVLELDVPILTVDKIVVRQVRSPDNDCVVEDCHFLVVHSTDFPQKYQLVQGLLVQRYLQSFGDFTLHVLVHHLDGALTLLLAQTPVVVVHHGHMQGGHCLYSFGDALEKESF